MANPNIVNVTTINANTAVLSVTTTAANIITNPDSSGKVYKINALTVSNGNLNSTSANVTVDYQKSGTFYPISANVKVPAQSTLVVVSKDSGIYLLEGNSLRCWSSTGTEMTAVLSFEEIS